MKLVIDIDEYLYNAIMVDRFGVFNNAPCEVIRNGTPLPKHENLISREALIKAMPIQFYTSFYFKHIIDVINNTPTIIKADKGEK